MDPTVVCAKVSRASPASGTRPTIYRARTWVHHWNAIAVDASGSTTHRWRPAATGLRREPGPSSEPRDGDRSHRDLRCGERDRRRLSELPAWPPRAMVLHQGRRRSGRARAFELFLAARDLDEQLDGDLSRIPERGDRAKDRSGAAGGRPFLPARRRWLAAEPYRCGLRHGQSAGAVASGSISRIPLALGAGRGRSCWHRVVQVASCWELRMRSRSTKPSAWVGMASQPTERTGTETGICWAYDGTPSSVRRRGSATHHRHRRPVRSSSWRAARW